jgi:hypothetical protein
MILAVNSPLSRWEAVSPNSTIVSGRRPTMEINYLTGEESYMENSTGEYSNYFEGND